MLGWDQVHLGLEPQITIGLLTGADGFPLMVSAFEGNKAETKTMLPVIQAFMAAHQLPDVTVVADAGMVSEANQKAIEAAGLSSILGAKIPHEPYVVQRWRRRAGCSVQPSTSTPDCPARSHPVQSTPCGRVACDRLRHPGPSGHSPGIRRLPEQRAGLDR